MRIIAGTARGREILSVSKKVMVKPISGRIKQSVFDIIRPYVCASRFLDLFSGTGSVGLEALSRGAMSVVFVEKRGICVKVITKNLARLGFKDKAKVFKSDVLANLSWLKRHSDNEGYDIIFMGPPYRDDEGVPFSLTQPALKSVSSAKILAPKGTVVVQHHKKETYEIPENFEMFRQEKYGDTAVSFFKYAKV
jgi:16S rRNA (guanine966-N2)-methyltransferase